MRKLAFCITLAVAFAAVASASAALTFDDIQIETWVGSGTNKSVLVVDFGPESFAFGYNFDGAKSGWDMISDVAANTDLEIAHNIQFGGPVVYSIGYHGYLLSYDSLNYDPDNPSHWWEYWTSPDGAVWQSSWVGCQDRELADGAWDGWTFSPPWPNPSTPPHAPVPEPSSVLALCSLIGLAGSTKLLRRK